MRKRALAPQVTERDRGRVKVWLQHMIVVTRHFEDEGLKGYPWGTDLGTGVALNLLTLISKH